MQSKRHPPYWGEDIVCSAWKHAAVLKRTGVMVTRNLERKVKHMVGITRNEQSRRYVDEEPEFYFPEQWRGRPTGSVKQGSSGVVSVPEGRVEHVVEQCLALYNHLMSHDNVAPEQARMILPQNMMTEWVETASLAAVCRACKLRLDPHAQQETREIAEMIAELVAPMFPVSWSALMEN